MFRQKLKYIIYSKITYVEGFRNFVMHYATLPHNPIQLYSIWSDNHTVIILTGSDDHFDFVVSFFLTNYPLNHTDNSQNYKYWCITISSNIQC